MEFAFQDNMVVVPPGLYWVRGGPRPSAKLGDEFLRAHPRHVTRDGPRPQDTVPITVLWVELSGHVSGRMLDGKLFEPHDAVLRQQGHDNLGVHRSVKKSDQTDRFITGGAEFRGKLLPPMGQNSPGPRLSTGLSRPDEMGTRATVDFGFIFRRDANYNMYDNASTLTINTGGVFIPDDTERLGQDVDPDPGPGGTLIVDNDAPGYGMPGPESKRQLSFIHLRYNFNQYVVFRGQPDKPAERVSRVLPWACTLDIARDYEDRAVLIRGPANNGSTNSVLIGRHLDDLQLNFNESDDRPQLTDARTPAGDKTLRDGKPMTLVLKGRSLYGHLRKAYKASDGSWQSLASLGEFQVLRVEANENSTHSSATEARVTFVTHFAPSAHDFEWGVLMKNAAGESNVIGGFRVTQ